MAHGYRNLQQWNQWLTQHFLGGYLIDEECQAIAPLFTQHFGKHALLIGTPQQARYLAVSNIHCQTLLTPISTQQHQAKTIESDLQELPIASGSVDLVLLPHTLEFVDNPRQLLNEACRIIKPEGLLLISGFNPTSSWGLRRRLHANKIKKKVPWAGNIIYPQQIRSWLTLLDFVLEKQTRTLFAPPIGHLNLHEKLKPMGWFSRMIPGMGGSYLLLARAKVIPMTPIRLKWKQQISALPLNNIPGHAIIGSAVTTKI